MTSPPGWGGGGDFDRRPVPVPKQIPYLSVNKKIQKNRHFFRQTY
jgi:hypothetical protein